MVLQGLQAMNILRVSRASHQLSVYFVVYVSVVILVSYGWATAAAALPPVELRPGANAALYYYQAFQAMPRIPVRTINGAFPRVSDYPLDKTTLRQLQAAKWSLRLLRLGSKMPACNWGVKPIFGQFNFVPPLKVLGPARVLGEIALLEARRDWGKKHWKIANSLVAAAFVMAHDVGEGHMPLGIFTEDVMNDIYIGTLARNSALLPKAELRALQPLVDNLPPLTPMTAALQPGSPEPLRIVMRQLLKRHLEASIWQWVVTMGKQEKNGQVRQRSKPLPPVPADFAAQVRAAISAMERHDKELEEAMATPYPRGMLAVKRACRHIKMQDSASGNPVLRTLAMPWWEPSYYAAQCGTEAHRTELRAALAYLLGGREAFDKIHDPFGPGPLILEKNADRLLIRSHLDTSYLVGSATAKLEASLTVPLH